ncbi:MAG: chorismate mutase [Candidatus Omnitrophota bacterium]|nr:chorismate mutase [Candidatus Omnitrophota bacterium]
MWQDDGWKLEIKRFRDMLDENDEEIVNKLGQRMQLCEKIGEIKSKQGLSIYVPQREREILEKRLEWGLKHNLRLKFIRVLFKVIISESKKRQKELIEIKAC